MLERCVGETLHVANDMTLATASVTSVAWTTAWANHFKMSFFTFLELLILFIFISYQKKFHIIISLYVKKE